MAQRIDRQMKWLFAGFWLLLGMAVAMTSLPRLAAQEAKAPELPAPAVATPQAAEKPGETKAAATTPAPAAPVPQSPSPSSQSPAPAAAVTTRGRVLIVSIDGLRPDLALLADMPNLRSLMKAGTYSMWAQTLPIGKTLPSHTSMITGVTMEKHGIYWNEDWLPKRFNKDTGRPRWPTLLERAKEKGLTTALCAGKAKFDVLADPQFVDHSVVPEPPRTVPGPGGIRIPILVKPDEKGLTEYDHKYSDNWVAENAERIILQYQPQVMYVHFARVDSAGHAKGWGSPQQLEAIELADNALGRVLDALKQVGVYHTTTIIVSADHGGMGRTHDGKDPRGLHIPWVIRGPNIKRGYDLTQIQPLVVNTMDTFATACHVLHIPIRPDDAIDGKVVYAALESTDYSTPDSTEKPQEKEGSATSK